VFVTLAAVAMSLFHLYTAYAIVPTQTLRPLHVAMVLVLCFLSFPYPVASAIASWCGTGWPQRLQSPPLRTCWSAATTSPIATHHLRRGHRFRRHADRAGARAMRRTTGWVMPVITLAFLLYALFGPYLPAPWTHKGYDVGRVIGHMYMTLEGIFGVAVDVSSSLIILFTIFGAFLQYSGAGKFFIDFSFAAMGAKPTGAGRTVCLPRPARWSVGLRRRNHRDDRVGRLSDARQGCYGKNAAGGLLAPAAWVRSFRRLCSERPRF